MAVAAEVLTDAQRATLAALCDTYVPAVESDTPDPVEREFMARSASDMAIPARIEATVADTMTPDELAGFAGLLDALAGHGIADLPVEARTELVHGTVQSDPEAKFASRRLKALAMLLFYALPDEQGQNPNWEAIGYPGPISAPPSPKRRPKTITVQEVEGDEATLTADVCVVGSGAGGSVIAAELAAAGKSVLVLEMGGYRNEQDFKQLELPAMQELYYGAGLAASEDGLDRGARRLHARRRHGRELHELHPNARADPARVGRARPGRPGRPGLRGRPHRRGRRPARRQHGGDEAERDASAAHGGARRQRARASADRAQRDARRRPGSTAATARSAASRAASGRR